MANVMRVIISCGTLGWLAACAPGGAGQGDALRAGVITAKDGSTVNYTVHISITGGAPGGVGGTPSTSVPITVPVSALP